MAVHKITQHKYSKVDSYYLKHRTVQINPAEFNALIASHGVRILHEKITLCPNYRGDFDSNVHVLECPVCNGSNFIHFDPVEMWGLFQQNELVDNFFTQGWWERGTALLTVPTYTEEGPEYPIYINYFDRITLLDFEERFYELVHKSEGDTDKLRFQATSVNFLRTTYKEYKYHKDFELDQNGNILWISPNRPTYDLTQDVGELFTISYLRKPVYRVVELLHEGRYAQYSFKKPYTETMRYPQRALIKKDFLVQNTETEKKGIVRVEDLVGGGGP
jgi:hypothetical protein